MYAESNKAVCRRFIQKIFNEGELSLIQDFVSPSGIEGTADLAALYHRTFSDFRLEIKEQVAEGDRVVTFLRLRGAQKNPLMRIGASGSAIEVTGIRVDRFANGKIAESSFQLDALGERLLQGDCLVDCMHCDEQICTPAPFGRSDSPFTVKRDHLGNGCGTTMPVGHG